MELVRRGWRKTDGKPPEDDPSAAFFSFRDTADNPEWPYAHRLVQFDLYPQYLDHGSDLSLGCNVDEHGRLFNWSMIERYSGSGQPVDPAGIELTQFAIAELLADWEASWGVFER